MKASDSAPSLTRNFGKLAWKIIGGVALALVAVGIILRYTTSGDTSEWSRM